MQADKAKLQPAPIDAVQLPSFFSQSQATNDRDDAILSRVQPFGRGIGARFHNKFCIPGGYQDIVRLADDFYLNVFDETFAQDLVERTAGGDWLTVSCRLQGRTRELLGDDEQIERAGPRCYVLTVPVGLDRTAWYQSGQRVRTVSVSFRAEAATKVLGLTSADFPLEVRPFLEGTARETCFRSLSLSVPMLHAINDILDSPYAGNLRRLHAEAKALELVSIVLASLARRVPEDPLPVRLRSYDIECLNRAREILETRYADPPTIAELARQVGVNTKKLKLGFKHLFGSTLLDFCHQVRMRHGQALLRDGNLNIAQVSDRLGYSHPRNFSAAFRRHYGILPKEQRSQR